MPITRSQAHSIQPPPGPAPLDRSHPQHLTFLNNFQRVVNHSLQAVGGGLTMPLVRGNARPLQAHKCKSDCMSYLAFIKNDTIFSIVATRKHYFDIESSMM